MKIFLAVVTARQIEGDMIWVRVEKANTSASIIDEYVKKTGRYLSSFDTEFGPIQCECTVGAIEVELEEGEVKFEPEVKPELKKETIKEIMERK